MDDYERAVEGMGILAEQVVMDVFREFTISHVVAAYSGGDDSIVSTHWAMNRFPGALVMIGDTLIGLDAARRHSSAVCAAQKWDKCIVSPDQESAPPGWVGEWTQGNTPYEDFVLNCGFPGPGQHGRMYQRLKQRAFRKVKKHIGRRPRGSRILIVSGIRHDESAIRAGYKRAYREEPKECFVWMNPFYHADALSFEMYRIEHGLPRNPVKKKCGISGECCCGAFAAPGEREAYRDVEPSFADYLDRLEERVNQTFPWGWQSGPPKWHQDKKRGQLFLFGQEDCDFMPACVGCHRRNRKGSE